MQTLKVGSASVTQMSRGTNDPAFVNPNTVNFKVAYPKDWKGPTDMPDGDVVQISKESAEHFTKIGIGSVLSADDYKAHLASLAKDEAAEAKADYSKLKKKDLQAELKLREVEFDEAATNAELISLLEVDDESKAVSE